jgi:hypothetical protein
LAKREAYSKIKNERERATFTMMMKMNPDALTAIRKEFYMREDAVKVEEFVFLINKHLMAGAKKASGEVSSLGWVGLFVGLTLL